MYMYVYASLSGMYDVTFSSTHRGSASITRASVLKRAPISQQ